MNASDYPGVTRRTRASVPSIHRGEQGSLTTRWGMLQVIASPNAHDRSPVDAPPAVRLHGDVPLSLPAAHDGPGAAHRRGQDVGPHAIRRALQRGRALL